MLTRKGLEAIMFQSQSSLGKALTAVFQDAIDYRNNLKFNENDLQIRKKRIDKVFTYVEKTTIPKFIDTVKRETNLDIVEVELSGTGGLTGMFAVYLGFDNESAAIDLIKIQIGNSPPPKNIKSCLKEMQEMSELLDMNTGKLTASIYGKNNRRKISCKMYMDPMTAFCLHDFIPVKMAEPLTAEEIAAIYIHEIGHVLTVVERSSHFYMVTERQTKHLSELVQNTDPKLAIQDFIELGLPTLHQAVKDKQLDPKIVAVTENALKTATYLLEKETSSTSGTIGELILYTVRSILIVCFKLYFMSLFGAVFVRTITNLQNEFSFKRDIGKSSDLVNTTHNAYQLERMADEFVSRHGFGGYVASALEKIRIIFSHLLTLGSGVWSTKLRRSKIFYKYVQLITFVFRVVNVFKLQCSSYENDINRTRRLIQNAHAVFKNDLPPHTLNSYLDDYSRLDKILSGMEKSISNKTYDILYKYLLQFAQPETILAMILTGRFTNDYEKLQNQVEDIINNKLYYTSAKFKQLANRK